jgi:hypothetical protein
MPRSEEQPSRAYVIAALAGVAMHALLSRPLVPGSPPLDRMADDAVDAAEALLAEIERRHGSPL